MAICKHIRRFNPQPAAGYWHMRCDCGWADKIARVKPPSMRDMSQAEAYEELNKLFTAHLRSDEMQTYVLVDARVFSPYDPETGEPEKIYGNFIMPEAVGVRLIRNWEDRGVRWAEVQEWDPLKVPVTLPIGEIRTREGRVFRLD